MLRRSDTDVYSTQCPETTIIFSTFGRSEIAERSFNSLARALEPLRQRIRIILSDSTPKSSKLDWMEQCSADDLIWTPRTTSAATARNLAYALMMDKYSSEFVCFVEDDFEYSPAWYPRLVECARRNYGKLSPWGVPYGMFSASTHALPDELVRHDAANNISAYTFGAVADQRFMPVHHYAACLRMWDPDVLGLSYCQTGMQTARNTMRGFCGGIIRDERLSWPIEGQESTWREGSRDVGPAAHDMNPAKFQVIRDIVGKMGGYRK